MVVQAARINRPVISAFASVALWTLVFPVVALADPLGAGDGAIYMLTPAATYQEGCFPPCMCPIMIEQPIIGTFKLIYKGQDNTGVHSYAVEDVNWTVPFFNPPLRITGSGKYGIGSPNPITLMQQRMELDLKVGANAPAHFDSGWVPLGDMSRLNITISMHNQWCFDRVIGIDAVRVPDGRITPYVLAPGATFQEGCWDPCDCILHEPWPMVGDFALAPLSDNTLFREFAVLNVRWEVLSPAGIIISPIRGYGIYRVGGEFAVQHQLSLELWVGADGPRHFDSGWIPGGGQFPEMDIVVSMNRMWCWDRVLHVVAKPAVGNVICGGIGGLPCPDGFFCKLPVGACCCDFMGVCAPIPTGCPRLWDPVCGCDGVTYANECEADRAGVTIAYRGECRQVCGGIAGIPCPEGQFCKFPIGTCDIVDNQGVCAPIPGACITLWDPVCGCDGRTYGNECEADRAGVSIAHGGECRQVCGGIGGLPCDPGEFCKLPVGSCNISDPMGVCRPSPQFCPLVWMPVCGCDGRTYGNECEADRAGVPVAHYGECVGTCGGITGIPCPAGYFCVLPDGACCCDFLGVCEPVPAACPDVWDPVCGCDGRTYGNRCEAHVAHVNVAYAGECRQTCSRDPNGATCAPGEFCKFPIGACNDASVPGVCTPIPGDCPLVYDPVCGCDGRTYGNECEADAAGVSLAHRGPCEVGACCTDLGGSPLPVPVCTETTADQCQMGIFQGPGTTCEPTEACCMPWDNNACVDISRFCCEAFAGIPKGLGSSCVDPTGVNVCGRICGGLTGYRCEPGEFCKFPEGICSDATDRAGVCTPIPNACPEVYDPVCGCDGVTYGNACEAERAAVSVKHPGVCLPSVCAASRVLSDPEPTYCPGSPKPVRIVLTPPNTAQVLGVEDSPPRGWIVTNNISHGGGYDPVNGKVKWGPLFPPFPAALTYEVIPTEVTDVPPCFAGQISVNGDLEPICGDMCLALFCCPRMEADEPQPACNTCPVGDCSSCGAGACEDGQVTLCEVIGYACSWMRGCNDDLSGMTRAAYIWRSGECYCWDDGQQKWMPTSCPAPDSGCCPAGTPGSSGGSAAVEVSTSTLEVPSTLSAVRDKAVRAWNVPVTIEAPSGTTAAALEVQVPGGWVVTTISDDGTWDATHRKIKWGPFFDDLSRTVMFQVRPAVESDGGKTRTLRGGLRSIGLSGTVSFDGVNHPITVR